MAPPGISIARWRRENPNQLLLGIVAVVALGVALWLGFSARSATLELARKRDEWARAANRLATVQQQFRVPTSTESAALVSESARLGVLGVPESEKLSLLESIGRLAEACALTQVRARSIASDSVYTPERSIGAEEIKPAGYAVALEFRGSFAGLVQFVSSLPPSVSVSQLRAARFGDATRYYVVLSVYELDAKTS
jgi:hypothetical protein